MKGTLPYIPALAAFALAASTFLACGSAEDSRGQRNVRRSALLITIDTLRADRLQSYGFPGPSSPNIDALAEMGVLFENAIAAASVTAPSHASIMTGHFVRGNSIGSSNGGTRLSDTPTLASRFRDAGYDTGAFVGNWVLLPRIGLDHGFRVYDAELTRAELNRPDLTERIAEETAQRAIAWLEEPRDEPFFLWVQLQDPHGPFTPPAEWRGRFEPNPAAGAGQESDSIDRVLEVLPTNSGVGGIPAYQVLSDARTVGDYETRYVEEVGYTDVWVGRLLAAANAAAGERGLAVVLTADHGESLGERGFYYQHGHSITPELARVPFVIAAPALEPARRSETVHHIDILPTLLDLAGVPAVEGTPGLALGSLVSGAQAIPDRVVFSDIGRELGAYSRDSFVRVVGSPDVWGDWAGGRGARGKPPASLLAFEAFDERGQLVRHEPDPEMRRAIEAYLRDEVRMTDADGLSASDETQLRALGYLEPENADAKPAR